MVKMTSGFDVVSWLEGFLMNYITMWKPVAWALLNAVILVIGHVLTRGLEARLMNFIQEALIPNGRRL